MIARFHNAPTQEHEDKEEVTIVQGKGEDNSKWEAPAAKKR